MVAWGCAPKQEAVPEAKNGDFLVSCIAVMPVVPVAESEGTVSPAEEKALVTGSQVMNGLLKEQLAGRAKVRFAREEQVPAGILTANAARQVAGQMQCNTVLEVSLNQFSERVGGDYGVKQPAAVTFAYKLYEVGEGRMLCHGRFDERQQSVMENLLALPKARSRGLTWLTAEELARDGLQERLGQCSYLGGK
jgi:hypothetical protein